MMTALSRRHVLAAAAATVAAAALPAVAVAVEAVKPPRRWPATYIGEGPPSFDFGVDGDLYGYPMSTAALWDIKRDGVWVRFADYRGMV
jgi:hypothetical protein